ncbi:MAG: hypothetical protein ACLP1X_22385 [Polyangiaceae bacterium]
MVRFDGSTETWATKLTDTAAAAGATPAVPAYGTSATTGNNIIFIWSEYAHNGRIAFDGSNYAGYFGAAITVPGQACVGQSTLTTGVNIHQGDRMQIVNGSGVLQTGGFDWGCSHSGYERIIWDPSTSTFATVCKNDAPTDGESGRLAYAPATTTIDPIDLSYSDFGSVLMANGTGRWLVTSDIRSGQTPNADGLADIHLLHVPETSPTPDKNLTLVSDPGKNDRAPHLAAFGNNRVLAAWETSTATGDLAQNDPDRTLYVQALDGTTGVAQGTPFNIVGVLGSRYQDFRAFPDNSVAYPAPGSSGTTIKIVRILPCP